MKKTTPPDGAVGGLNADAIPAAPVAGEQIETANDRINAMKAVVLDMTNKRLELEETVVRLTRQLNRQTMQLSSQSRGAN